MPGSGTNYICTELESQDVKGRYQKYTVESQIILKVIVFCKEWITQRWNPYVVNKIQQSKWVNINTWNSNNHSSLVLVSINNKFIQHQSILYIHTQKQIQQSRSCHILFGVPPHVTVKLRSSLQNIITIFIHSGYVNSVVEARVFAAVQTLWLHLYF